MIYFLSTLDEQRNGRVLLGSFEVFGSRAFLSFTPSSGIYILSNHMEITMKKVAVELFLGGLVLSLLMLVSACDSGQMAGPELAGDPDERVDYADPLVQFLVSKGIEVDDIVDNGDYFTVEGDMVFDKEKLRRDLEKKTAYEVAGKAQQRATADDVVSYSNVQNITVRVDSTIPTSGDDDWHAAVQDAITEWNNSTSSDKLKFVYTTSSSADIDVVSDNGVLPNGAIADAIFPGSGDPGNRIRINLDFNNDQDVGDEQKLYNMVHELGHTIGFAHTNSGAFQVIPRTPSSETASVMNGGSAGRDYEDYPLTSNDEKGSEVFYPSSLPTPSMGSGMYQQGSGLGAFTVVHIFYSLAGSDDRSANIQLWRKKNSGSWELYRTPGYSSTHYDDVVLCTGNPTYSYKIRTQNFGGDKLSSYSTTKTIQIQCFGGGF